MASKTEIANRIFLKLGYPRIANVDTDQSPQATAVSEIWNTVRDSLFYNYPWNFAIKRADVAASGTAPVWGWDNAFPLPTDCVRILELKNISDYEVEGDMILADTTGPLYIRYISRIEDVGLWSPAYIETFVIEMAIEVNDRITDDNTKKQLLLAQKRDIIDASLRSDSVENPPKNFEEDDWVLARI